MRFFFLPLILIGWPLAEIAGFVMVGRALGLWATLGLVIGTAVLGVFLLRSQGMHLLKKLSEESREGKVPGRSLIDGAMIVVAGILLLLPGFLTDIIGIALFIPFVRTFIWGLIGKRVVVMQSPNGTGFRYSSGYAKPEAGPRGPVVDLDDDDFHRGPSTQNPSSPWIQPKRDEP